MTTWNSVKYHRFSAPSGVFNFEQNFDLWLYGYDISAIDPDRDTVLLTHGWLGPGKDIIFDNIDGKSNYDLANLNAPYIPQLADSLSGYQVLYLDWSSAARDSLTLIPREAAGRILKVSDFVSDQLRHSGAHAPCRTFPPAGAGESQRGPKPGLAGDAALARSPRAGGG